MKEIATTSFGRNALRNALMIGLISHGVALFVSMMPISGAGIFFTLIYPFYWLLFICGAYAEINREGQKPFGEGRFYLLSAIALIPLIGPIVALEIIYAFQEDRHQGRFEIWRMVRSILGLRVNPIVLILYVVILIVLFTIILYQYDPYFKRAKQRGSVFSKEQALSYLCVDKGKS